MDRIEHALDRLDRQVEETNRQVGRVTDGLGRFAEGLVAPSIPKVMGRAGVELDGYHCRSKKRRGADTMEIDVLGVGRWRGSGKPVVVAVEVKTYLHAREVSDWVETLPRFFDFFDEFADYDLIGAVAGMQLEEAAVRHAEGAGLVVLGPGDEVARWLNTKRFVPRVWRRRRR